MSALGSLSAAILPPEHGGPDPDAMARLLAAHLARMPRSTRAGVHAGAAALDWTARVRTGHSLRALDPDRRASLLRAIARLHPGIGLGVEGLKGLVALAHGADSHADSMRARASARPPARTDPRLDVTPAGQCNGVIRCDTVVVGSGAGGALAALALVRAGHSVVIVEEGRRWSVTDFRQRHPLERFGELYRDGGATVALGRPPIALPMGRGVGGTTLVNSGTCYPPPGEVRRAWHASGVRLAEPEALERRLAEVQALLDVAPVPSAVMGRNGELALAGAQALGWRAGPLRRNAPGCGGCCQCSIGCPRNAKAGVHLNALPAACAEGGRIVSEGLVERVMVENGQARGVLVRAAGGRRLRIDASRVVVAAGATETPPLLRRSGLGHHPALGRHLSIHPAVGVAGRFSERVVAWEGVLQSAGVEELHEDRGILIEATSTPPGMGSLVLPGIGEELLREIEDAPHLATLGAMVADGPTGRVIGRRRGATLIWYSLARETAARLIEAMAAMARVLFAAGAHEVITGVPGVPALKPADDARTVLQATDPRLLHLAAFHPGGTARAGGDPATAPVDPDGRLRGTPGVWVSDASILPSSPTVNPQISIMALALGVGENAGRG
jgi:choline dehydrogenase-like flavoprotein